MPPAPAPSRSPSTTRAPALLPLCAGLVLGAAAAWTVRHFTAPPSSAPLAAGTTGAPVSAHPELPAAGASPAARPVVDARLVLPALLEDTEADAALADYLAQPALPDDAPAADIQARTVRLNALLTLLPTGHFEKLFATLATRVGNAEAQLRRTAFAVWIERDAPAAARWALSIVPGEAINKGARERYLRQAALAWSRTDFAAALAWSEALPEPELVRGLRADLLGRLAATDPARALALIDPADEESADAARRQIFQVWAERDPAAALRSLGPVLLGEQQRESWRVTQALSKWIARDPDAAIDWAVAQPAPDGEAYRSLINQVGWQLAEDPDAVRPFLDALAKRDDIPGRSQAYQNVFGNWMRKDSAKALDWLATVPDAALRTDLVERGLGYIPQEKPDEFVALLRELPTASAREQQLANRLSQWAKQDPDAALAWIEKNAELPEMAAASRQVESTLIASLAATDAQAAIARWQALPADADRAGAARQIAQAWAKTDPAAATRWVFEQTVASDKQSPNAFGNMHQLLGTAANWARTDPLAYVDWAQSLPDENQRNVALNAIGQEHYWGPDGYENRADPPPRATYAEQLARIPDEGLRERTLSNHLRTWMRSDLQAARAWIETTDALSPEAAARLLTQAGVNY